MQFQDLSFIPKFIQEVADFKSFIHGYQSSGATHLIGLGEMYLFKFYVDDDGWPVMRYKKSVIDAQCLPLNRPPIIGLRGVCFGKSRGVWLLLVMT